MDELPFKIVRLQGSQDRVIARVENFLICKAAFEKALFVYPDAHLARDAARGEDYFEVARRTALLIDRCANLNVADSINGHALAYRRGTGGGDVARTCRHRARCGNSPGFGDSALVGQATGFNDL
jgi:hypothetical protein